MENMSVFFFVLTTTCSATKGRIDPVCWLCIRHHHRTSCCGRNKQTFINTKTQNDPYQHRKSRMEVPSWRLRRSLKTERGPPPKKKLFWSEFWTLWCWTCPLCKGLSFFIFEQVIFQPAHYPFTQNDTADFKRTRRRYSSIGLILSFPCFGLGVNKSWHGRGRPTEGSKFHPIQMHRKSWSKSNLKSCQALAVVSNSGESIDLDCWFFFFQLYGRAKALVPSRNHIFVWLLNTSRSK